MRKTDKLINLAAGITVSGIVIMIMPVLFVVGCIGFASVHVYETTHKIRNIVNGRQKK